MKFTGEVTAIDTKGIQVAGKYADHCADFTFRIPMPKDVAANFMLGDPLIWSLEPEV